MRSIYFYLSILIFVLYGLRGNAQPPLVIGYLPYWTNWEISEIDANSFNLIKLSFLEIKNNKIYLPNDKLEKVIKDIQQLQQLKAKNPALKIMISIGGWGVDGFSQLTAKQQGRTDFINSIANFLVKYDIDGVDIDWEFPVKGSSSIASNLNDKENLNLLISELRNKLDKIGYYNNKNYIISLAVGISQDMIYSFDFLALSMNIDHFGLMTYNMSGATWSKFTDHHAPLYSDKETSWSSSNAVELITAQGVATTQLILGIPFYGRKFTNVSNYNQGLYQNFTWDHTKDSVTYNNIVNDYLENTAYHHYFDKKTKGEYLYNKTDHIFISYVGKDSLKAILNYVKKSNLQGVMIWEITQDNKNGSKLIEVMKEQFNTNS